tara:strand:- start:171 stop:563 length:393 start_codon:yes stop_codon:yes gene_type:complete
MLYKNHNYSLETNIEAQRSTSQYLSDENNTNSGAGREYILPTYFQGSSLLSQIGRGYIVNDTGTGTLYVKFKFRSVGLATDLATEAWSDGVEVLPGQKLDFYILPLISAIRVENVPVNPGLNLLYRIFAT